jgi:hypothetical protein
MNQARRFMLEMQHYIHHQEPRYSDTDVYKIQLLAGSLKTALARVDKLEAAILHTSASVLLEARVAPGFWTGTVFRAGEGEDEIVSTFDSCDGNLVLDHLAELNTEMAYRFCDQVLSSKENSSVTFTQGDYKVSLTRKA